MTKPEIIVIGAGGHARVLIDILRRRGEVVAAAIDANPALHGKPLDGVPVIGGDDAVLARDPAAVLLVNGVGNIPGKGTSGLGRRRAVFERFMARGYRFMGVISPDAMVSSGAAVDSTAQVVTGAIVHPGAVIGANAIVNTGAQIDHDCILAAHSHVAPGAVLCGAVRVGAEAHVGAGAVVVPGIAIGEGAVIGAGAVVNADVPAGSMVLGIPARAPIRV